MAVKHGSLSINSENIFPIIKKWLYSDHDIFIREVVSNACDAITKLKKLDLMSEASLPDDYKAAAEARRALACELRAFLEILSWCRFGIPSKKALRRIHRTDRVIQQHVSAIE